MRAVVLLAVVPVLACDGATEPVPLDACADGPVAVAVRVEGWPELEHGTVDDGVVTSLSPLRIAYDGTSVQLEPAPAAGTFALGQVVSLLVYGVCTGPCQFNVRLAEPAPDGDGAFLAAAWTGSPPFDGLAPGLGLEYEDRGCPLVSEACAEDAAPLVLTATASDGAVVDVGPQREAVLAGYRVVNGHSRVAHALTCPNLRAKHHLGVVYRLP